jgi:AAA domain
MTVLNSTPLKPPLSLETKEPLPPYGQLPLTPEASLLPGVNVLLIGPGGTGKTHSLGTLVDYGAQHGIEVFYAGLESGFESLRGYWTDRGREIPSNLHWHMLNMIAESGSGFEHFAEKAKQVGSMTQDALHKLQDHTRSQRNFMEKFIRNVLIDFQDQRTGTKFGSVGTWGPNRALAIDGLTGLGLLAMSLVIGNKPVRSQADWGIAQDSVEPLVRQLCDGCKCHFILLGHVERETDQLSGGTKITVSSLGRALPPKLPPMFSDVILAVRVGKEFSWDTANPMVDLKTRNLEIASKIAPDFKLILDKWQSRGGRFVEKVKS